MRKSRLKLLALMLLLVCFGFFYDVVVANCIKVLPTNIEHELAVKYMPDKLWLHRVNSVEKQKELADKYQGIEFDIVFIKEFNRFENSHDRENLEKYDLEKQFSEYAVAKRKQKIWLDFKNLDKENMQKALSTLDHLVAHYDINKKNIIIESGNWENLKIFKEDGFMTSYYFTYVKDDKGQNDIQATRLKCNNIFKSGGVDAISFHGKEYNFVKNLNLPNNVVFLSWLDGKRWFEVWLRRKYKSMLEDERVKAILVRDFGKHHR